MHGHKSKPSLRAVRIRVRPGHLGPGANGVRARRLPQAPLRMKTLRLQLRFLVPLLLTLVVAALVALPLMDRLTLRWFARDLNSRDAVVANTLSDAITESQSDGKSWR